MFMPFSAMANIWKGEVKTKSGEPVEFATVLVMKGGKSIAGTTTNEKGEFNLNAPAGTYQLRITSVGFKDLEKAVTVKSAEQNLGKLVLEDMATELKGVEIKASFIKREADRFVVDVANAPGAIGKDGYELLKESPSVFVSNDELTVYGSTPTIYVNERRLNYSGTQLENYLRSLKAADIQKIEIVPQTGADYDANSAGGVIKITLKHRRNMGLDGETGIDLRGGKDYFQWNPYFKMNLNKEKFSFYYNLYSVQNYSYINIDEQTRYKNSSDRIEAHTGGDAPWRYSGGDMNFVYDLNNHQSIGATVEYAYTHSKLDTRSTTKLHTDYGEMSSKSRYYQPEYGANVSATVNYIDRIDSLGSTFKAFVDFSRNHRNNRNNNNTTGNNIDSTYNYTNYTMNILASARADYEKVIKPSMRLKLGAKYTFSRMESDGTGFYNASTIVPPSSVRTGILPEYTFDVNYNENVAALYATYTTSIGRASIVAGLRGEYTVTNGKGIDQKYFDLFPNLNIMYMLDKQGVWGITGQYSRTISRPNFWMLNPTRVQISEYTYREGNPYLDPGYTDTYGVTLLFRQKYSLTAMIRNNDGSPEMAAGTDENDTHIGYLRPTNTKVNRMYILSLNAPVAITKWWQLNLNVNGIYGEAQVSDATPRTYSSFVQGSAQNIFTLPKNTFFEIDYSMTSYARMATISVCPSYDVNVSLKRRMLNNRLTMSLAANNVLFKRQNVTFNGDLFERFVEERHGHKNLNFTLSLNYKFNTGKNYKSRRVESGASDDKSRMNKSN